MNEPTTLADLPTIPTRLAKVLSDYGSLPDDDERECDMAIRASTAAIRRMHGLPVEDER